jgi:biopolymer transport protein ExbB
VGTSVLAERDRGPEAVAEAMHAERVRWRNAGDRHLIILGTLGNNVPFLGLFGTVLGVISAFENLRLKTPAAEDRTLDLIAEALAATAFGLLVAIPAVIAFNFFSRKMRVLLGSADEAAHTVLSAVHGQAHVKGSDGGGK